MPKVTKQTSRPIKTRTKVTRIRGGILSSVSPVSSLPEAYKKILIYGPNRAGKTHLACQFPKPLLVLSFEPGDAGGLTSVEDFKGVDTLLWGKQLESIADVLSVCEELHQGSKYKVLVVDSATSLQDRILQGILNLAELPVSLSFGTVSTDQYRMRAEQTREVLRKLLGCPLDVVVTAKERDHNDNKRTDDGKLDFRPKFVKPLRIESYIAADVGGATAGWLHDHCDYVFRIYKDEELVERRIKVGKRESVRYEKTGRYVRHLLMDYHPNYAGGCRLGAQRNSLPESGIIADPTYQKIKEIIGG